MSARKVPPTTPMFWKMDDDFAALVDVETGLVTIRHRTEFSKQPFVIVFRSTDDELVGLLRGVSFDHSKTDVIRIGKDEFNVSRETYICMKRLSETEYFD